MIDVKLTLGHQPTDRALAILGFQHRLVLLIGDAIAMSQLLLASPQRIGLNHPLLATVLGSGTT